MVIKKCFRVKYPFLIEKIRSRIKKIISCEILDVKLITEPFIGIEIEGIDDLAVIYAEPEISNYILHLENDVFVSALHFVDSFTRPALKSPEMLQVCNELCNQYTVSLKLQLQPKALSSAAMTFDKFEVIVQICEGDIALDICNAFINFTDGNLTMCDEVRSIFTQAEIEKYHIEQNGPQPSGKALYFHRNGSTNTTVIHAVLPKWSGGNNGEGSLINSAVMESLRLAVQCKATTISLPFFSCVDDRLPLDVLAESCLLAIHNFAMRPSHVKKIRLVLPTNMADKFLDNFTTGIFKHFIVTDELDNIDPDSIQKFCDLGNRAWLWEGDDGKYNFYQPEDNKTLNKESAICFNSSCSLQIGHSICTVDFRNKTQVNMRTMNTRKVVCLPLSCVWQFRNHRGKWEQFPPQVTLMIEAMYLTGTDHNLTIDGQSYFYDFNQMGQLNLDSKKSTSIRRINSAAVFDDICSTAKSKITIAGLANDVNIVEEKLLQCLKSLINVHDVEVQKKFIPTLEKCIKLIQRSPIVVKIAKASENNAMVKYSVTGYKDCVQIAAIEMYKVTATASCSIRNPIEWEPQCKSIELKDILKGSPEWTKICARMRMTLNCNVVSIKRIQNEFLWEKYVQHKELMSHKGNQSTVEMELFHGTRANSPKCIYESEEGFDMRYSREGMWGLGNYFAVNANYASCFAYKETDNILQFFLVKVLVGDSCEIPPDSTLRMPPFKLDGKVRHDTVIGYSKGSRICITYSNDKAYPFYLISYTI